MEYEKTEHFLAAMRDDGKFLSLDESFATTSPGYVDHPADAKRIEIYSQTDKLEEAPYYFENSARMRHWLKGCKMVRVTLHSTAKLS